MDAMRNDSAIDPETADESAVLTESGALNENEVARAGEQENPPEAASADPQPEPVSAEVQPEAHPEDQVEAHAEVPQPRGTENASPSAEASAMETPAASESPAVSDSPASSESPAKAKKRKSAPRTAKSAAGTKALVVFREGRVHYADESVVVLDLDEAAHPDTDVHDVVDKLSELRDAAESAGRAEAISLVADLIQTKALS